MRYYSRMKKNFAILLMTVFIDFIGVGLVIPIFAPLFLSSSSNLFDANTPENIRNLLLGLTLGAFPIFQFFGSPLLGGLSDKFGRKKILGLSLFGTFLGYVLMVVGINLQNFYLILLSRIIDGFTGGNISVATSAISDISKPEEKTKNFGILGAIFGICFVMGPFLGGVLSDKTVHESFSLTTPFIVSAALSFINLLLVSFVFKETLTKKIEKKVSLASGLRNLKAAFLSEKYQSLFISVFLLFCGFSFFTTFFQAFLVQKFSFTEREIGILFAYIGLWIAFTQGLLVRFIPKKFKPINVIFVCASVLAISIYALTIPNDKTILYFILPIVAISNGFIGPNLQTIISNSADQSAQGEIFGINQSVQALGSAAAPLISGFLFSISNSLPLIVAAILTVSAGFILKRKFI